jgi:hypothetical protein
MTIMPKLDIDKDALERALDGNNTKVAARILGVSSASVRKYRDAYGLTVWRTWKRHEVEYLKKYAHTISFARIAKKLRKTPNTVRCMANRLGITIDVRDMHTTIDELAEELGCSLRMIQSMMQRSDDPLPSLPMRYGLRGMWRAFDMDAVLAWLERGHILRFDRAPMNHRMGKLYDAVRPRWITQGEMQSIDPWIGQTSFHHQRKRGATPKPMLVGIRRDLAHESYYYLPDVYRHYYTYGETIPKSIKCDWLQDIREAWESVYIQGTEIEQYITRGMIGHYRQRKGFPRCHTRYAYLRSEVVDWCMANGLLDIAHRIKREAVTYQELMGDRARRQQTGRRPQDVYSN